MKLKIKFILFFTLLLSVIAISKIHAAPAPSIYIVNHSTNECALFMRGDECKVCHIPDGWEEMNSFECPQEYKQVVLDYLCVPAKSTYCCSEYSTGSGGDCEDLFVNHVEKRCAFVEDITDCDSLPENWEGVEICPGDYSFEEEVLECSTNLSENVTTNESTVSNGKISNLIYILSFVLLLEVIILLFLVRRRKRLK